MVQSMMALMALMLTLLFIFNQQQGIIRAERTLIRNEIAAQATSAAVDRLEEIGAMAFDRATVGGEHITDTTALTKPAFFGATSPQDIDDFHGADVVQEYVLWEDTLRFRVISTVTYAKESDPGQSTSRRTKFKKATVTVFSLDEPHPDTVRLSQSFSCGSLCKW